MPPWVTALISLIIITVLGTYMVYGEGFETAELTCRKTYNTCIAACSRNDSACTTLCGEAQTKCMSNAVAAATVINDGPLNRPFTNSSMAWAASLGSGLLGNSNTSGYMPWTTSAGSSTAISSYTTDTSRVYRPMGWDSGALGDSNVWGSRGQSSSKTATPAASTATPATPATPTSSWDTNRNTFPQQTLHYDGSYDPDAPIEGSYVVNVKRWKPHETPTQDPPGLTINAPTDAGTEAERRDPIPSVTQYIRNDIVPDSLKDLINQDVKDTMNSLFRNQYEIQYS